LEGKKKIEIGTAYLIILVIINVILILFYIIMLIYVNVELSNNIDAFIDVHLRMKESIILLLSVKSNFIVYKNKMEQNKYFFTTTWSKIESKKINLRKKIYLE
jgi:hypothetical protein